MTTPLTPRASASDMDLEWPKARAQPASVITAATANPAPAPDDAESQASRADARLRKARSVDASGCMLVLDDDGARRTPFAPKHCLGGNEEEHANPEPARVRRANRCVVPDAGY